MKSLADKAGPYDIKRNEVYYPSVTVKAKDFPHLSSLETGKEHHVRMKLFKKTHRADPTSGEQTIEVELRAMGEEKKGKSKLEESGY